MFSSSSQIETESCQADPTKNICSYLFATMILMSISCLYDEFMQRDMRAKASDLGVSSHALSLALERTYPMECQFDWSGF